MVVLSSSDTLTKVLVAGGLLNTGTLTTTTEIYDSSTGTWTTTGSMVTAARSSFGITILNNGNAFVAGGAESPDRLQCVKSTMWCQERG